jgi:hypothetical protein
VPPGELLEHPRDPELLPELIQEPGPAERPRLDQLETGLLGLASEGLLRRDQAQDALPEPAELLAVLLRQAAEVPDDLDRRALAIRVPAVGPLPAARAR